MAWLQSSKDAEKNLMDNLLKQQFAKIRSILRKHEKQNKWVNVTKCSSGMARRGGGEIDTCPVVPVRKATLASSSFSRRVVDSTHRTREFVRMHEKPVVGDRYFKEWFLEIFACAESMTQTPLAIHFSNHFRIHAQNKERRKGWLNWERGLGHTFGTCGIGIGIAELDFS